MHEEHAPSRLYGYGLQYPNTRSPGLIASFPARHHSACIYFAPDQIIENIQGGFADAIGRRLLSEPTAKLPLKGEGAKDNVARSRLHQLVRACGLKDKSGRPKIRKVLAEAKDIYDSLRGSGGYSLGAKNKWDPTRRMEKESNLKLRWLSRASRANAVG